MRTYICLLTALLLLLFTLPAMAAEEAAAAPRPERQGRAAGQARGVMEMAILNAADRLDLSEQQKAALAELRQDFQKEMTAVRAGNLQGNELRQAMQQKMAAMRQKVMDLLTPEQRQRMQDGVAARAHGAGGIQGLMAAAEKQQLSEAQKKRLEELKTTFQEETTALRGGEQRGAELMIAMQRLNASQRERLLAILTPEQRQKVEEEAQAAEPRREIGQARSGDPIMQRYAELDLNETQKGLIEKIEEARAAALVRVRQEAGEDREALRQKMSEVNQRVNQAIMAVLTPEQRQKLTAAGAGGRPQQGEVRPQRQGEGRPQPR